MVPSDMCVLCFNSQWRSVLVGLVSGVASLLILVLSMGYQDGITDYLNHKLVHKKCYHYVDAASHSYTAAAAADDDINWTKTLANQESECIFLAFKFLFPWPLWITLASYVLVNASLVVSAVYK